MSTAEKALCVVAQVCQISSAYCMLNKKKMLNKVSLSWSCQCEWPLLGQTGSFADFRVGSKYNVSFSNFTYSSQAAHSSFFFKQKDGKLEAIIVSQVAAWKKGGMYGCKHQSFMALNTLGSVGISVIRTGVSRHYIVWFGATYGKGFLHSGGRTCLLLDFNSRQHCQRSGIVGVVIWQNLEAINCPPLNYGLLATKMLNLPLGCTISD